MVEASIRKQRKKILKTTSSHTPADHGVVALRAPAEAAAAAQVGASGSAVAWRAGQWGGS